MKRNYKKANRKTDSNVPLTVGYSLSTSQKYWMSDSFSI